jgi:hypothetical protein
MAKKKLSLFIFVKGNKKKLKNYIEEQQQSKNTPTHISFFFCNKKIFLSEKST